MPKTQDSGPPWKGLPSRDPPPPVQPQLPGRSRSSLKPQAHNFEHDLFYENVSLHKYFLKKVEILNLQKWNHLVFKVCLAST